METEKMSYEPIEIDRVPYMGLADCKDCPENAQRSLSIGCMVILAVWQLIRMWNAQNWIFASNSSSV